MKQDVSKLHLRPNNSDRFRFIQTQKTPALGRGFFQSDELKDVGQLLKRIPDVMANNIGTTSKGGNKQAETEQLDVAGSVVRYPNVGLGTPHRISRCRSGKGCPGR